MPGAQIALEQRELLLRRPGLAGGDDQVFILAQQFALGRIGFELARDDAHRSTGRTVRAARAIGDILAAAETDAAKGVVQFGRVVAAEFGKHLPLALAGQIGAGAGISDEKARKAERRTHDRSEEQTSELQSLMRISYAVFCLKKTNKH